MISRLCGERVAQRLPLSGAHEDVSWFINFSMICAKIGRTSPEILPLYAERDVHEQGIEAAKSLREWCMLPHAHA